MKHSRFTVLGARGFIGSRLLSYLRDRGHECAGVVRGDDLAARQPLGHAIYCIGVTADFRSRPFDTVRAHVCTVADVLETAQFESLLYLSSTRIYAGAAVTREDTALVASPGNPEDYYNLTKLTGEALCLASKREGVRVVRLSNVYGDDFSSSNFLPTVIRDAIVDRRVILHNSLASEKDYVSISDVVRTLPKIAVLGQHRVYNLASGVNTSNREILECISGITGCSYAEQGNASITRFPVTDISRLRTEFKFDPKPLLAELPALVKAFERLLHDQSRS